MSFTTVRQVYLLAPQATSIAGAIHSQASILANLKVTHNLPGVIAGQSQVSDLLGLGGIINIRATLTAVSSTEVNLDASYKLAGTIASHSVVVGDVGYAKLLQGVIAGDSTVVGDTKIARRVVGQIIAESRTIANLGALIPISTTINGNSSITVNLTYALHSGSFAQDVMAQLTPAVF